MSRLVAEDLPAALDAMVSEVPGAKLEAGETKVILEMKNLNVITLRVRA